MYHEAWKASSDKNSMPEVQWDKENVLCPHVMICLFMNVCVYVWVHVSIRVFIFTYALPCSKKYLMELTQINMTTQSKI